MGRDKKYIDFEIDVPLNQDAGVWQRPGVLEFINDAFNQSSPDRWLMNVDSWIRENGLCG